MKKSSSGISRRWPLIPAILTALTGVGLSVYLQSRIARTEAVAAKLTAETLRMNTEQELNLFADVLESVCALHALSDAVDQAAMDEFVEKGLVYQHKVLGAFGLTQRITPWLRADIESKNPLQPGAYQVLQRGAGDTWIPAESKPFYYPLTWQSQANGLGVPVGFDFSSLGEEARLTIVKIENIRRPALVPDPIFWNQKTEVSNPKSTVSSRQSPISNQQSAISNSPAYWVFAPVIPSRAGAFYAPDTVIGFAVAVVRPDRILEQVAMLSASPAHKPVMSLTLSSGTGETIRRTRNGWLYRHPMEALGTRWLFECSLPASVTGRRSLTALAAGYVITALMTGLVLLLASRTQKIEREVRLRTEELRNVNARLEQTLRDRIRLEEEMSELAARERRKVGRDLHDSLGQKLTGAVFLSRSILDYLSNSKNQRPEILNRQSLIENQKTHARTLNETLKDAVAQVRNMARGLAPVTLNDERLCESLEQLAEEMTGLYGVSCEIIRCDEPSGLDRKAKEQLYLIAREAVNNAARHAQASRVTIRLTAEKSTWRLRIKDDGKGMPDPGSCGEGIGLRIMRHRSGLIGAAFSISSAPRQGTCVEITSG